MFKFLTIERWNPIVNLCEAIRRLEVVANTITALDALLVFQPGTEITLCVPDWNYTEIRTNLRTSRLAGKDPMFTDVVPVLDRLISSGFSLIVSFLKRVFRRSRPRVRVKFDKEHLDETAWAEVLRGLNITHGRNGKYFFTRLPTEIKAD